MKVYLAGGMRTEWRERVKAVYPEHVYLDPTTHGETEPAAYTKWDLDAIASADLIFAYLEASNPVGYNMAFELGVGFATGKRIIFVNERFANNTRPVSMLCETCATYATLDEGLQALSLGDTPHE